ncbi:uncharacterized protein V1513DRAFT_435670 [Lipomyces chichibuensis]|uniref:uncharacterized protein n=1 Tax=Lipomyces chichibuensis TaxID=1546026 RepID=UPI003343B6B6
MVNKDKKSPALNKKCRTETGLTRLQAASSSQGSEGTVSSVTSSAIFKRILVRQGENSRQEPESEEVFDVVSVGSDTPSAISISSGESSEVVVVPTKQRKMGPKRKDYTSTKRRNGPRTAGSRTTTGKGKVPLEYLEMVHEVVGAHSTPNDDGDGQDAVSASPKIRRRTKRHQSSDEIQSLEAEATSSKRFKFETLWNGKGKGKEKVIDLDSDGSMLEFKARSPTPAVEDLFQSNFASGLDVSTAEDNNTSKPTDEDEDGDDVADAEYASSEESEWEEVDMGAGMVSAPGSNSESNVLAEEPNTIEFTLGETRPAKPTKKKSTITREDKELRITVHALHLLSLLCHGSIRSRWCSDGSVKSTLAKYVPQAIEDELHPDPSLPIPQRTRKFLDGLRHLMDFWNMRYRIIYRGMCRRQWDEIGDMAREKNREPPMDLPDFRRALGHSEGSRDLGAQGFCALLRAFHVRTRLVFSLQPLPFSFSSKGLSKPSRASKAVLVENDNNESGDHQRSKSPANRPPVRLRKPRFSSSKMSYTMADYDVVKIEEAPYPVIWVEVWDEAGMQWVSVDPMVLKLVEIPKFKSKFEPPASESTNVLSYVIAFDSRGHAKDVTRRYAQFYNAKTRKLRITNEPIWQIWFDRVMRLFQSEYLTDIDQMEDAALLKKEASEELPNNIQDFKGHPIFVLERHLRQSEVIYPKVPCGAISAGRSKSNETEPIYRRRDVKLLRSAMQWYKIGRQVKIGEQPMKHIKKRSLPKSRSGMLSDEDDGIEEDEEVALYADFQTELYIPPPVINGKVPRNDYGNLDVFVPSMVPKGAVHLRFRGIANAAKLCGIDYVDAVGGFDFQHRKATARLDGIVVAEEYVEAVLAVYNAQQEQLQFDEDARRQEEALKRWRKYLIALRVRERVAHNPAFRQMENDNPDSGSAEHGERGQEQGGGYLEEYHDGGFFSEPPVDSPGGFLPDCGDEEGGFVPDDDHAEVGGFLVDVDEGRGFITDDNDEGGFVADPEEDQADAFL